MMAHLRCSHCLSRAEPPRAPIRAPCAAVDVGPTVLLLVSSRVVRACGLGSHERVLTWILAKLETVERLFPLIAKCSKVRPLALLDFQVPGRRPSQNWCCWRRREVKAVVVGKPEAQLVNLSDLVQQPFSSIAIRLVDPILELPAFCMSERRRRQVQGQCWCRHLGCCEQVDVVRMREASPGRFVIGRYCVIGSQSGLQMVDSANRDVFRVEKNIRCKLSKQHPAIPAIPPRVPALRAAAISLFPSSRRFRRVSGAPAKGSEGQRAQTRTREQRESVCGVLKAPVM